MKVVFALTALILSFAFVRGLENINLIGCAPGTSPCLYGTTLVSAYAIPDSFTSTH